MGYPISVKFMAVVTNISNIFYTQFTFSESKMMSLRKQNENK